MDFLKNTLFNGSWLKENGLAFALAIPGAAVLYKGVEWMFESFFPKDAHGNSEWGGFFGFIPRFFASVSAAGFALMAFPSIMGYMKETAIPWMGDKLHDAGAWAKKTVGWGDKGAVDDAPAPEGAAPKPKGVVSIMPDTQVKLADISYDGAVSPDQPLAAQPVHASAVNFAVKPATLTA